MTDWYKRYPKDFIDGTMGMSLEARGAYSIVLDLLYINGGPIVDDDRWLAGVMGVSTRKWRSLRQGLIDRGKIVEFDGRLDNVRSKKERELAAKWSRTRSEAGAKGGRVSGERRQKSSKNNGEQEAHASSDLNLYRLDKIRNNPPIIPPFRDDGLKTEQNLQNSLDGGAEAPPSSKYEFEGKCIRLTREDFVRWQKSFSRLDVRAELAGLDAWTADCPKRRKNWFVTVAAVLAKRNREAKERFDASGKSRASRTLDAIKRRLEKEKTVSGG